MIASGLKDQAQGPLRLKKIGPVGVQSHQDGHGLVILPKGPERFRNIQAAPFV